MRVLIILLAIFIEALSSIKAYAEDKEKFVVYYSDKADVKSFENYDLIILDSRYHPPINALTERGKTVLGYISLGEIQQKNPYFSIVKTSGALLAENQNWKGSYGVDIRAPLWQQTVIEEMIPAILRDGFDGIFIDTLDSPLDLERTNPKKYSGMIDASVRLIQAIRLHYPAIKIMVNRAYAALPRIAPYLDMELGESVRHTYNFQKKTYEPASETDYMLQVKWLQDVQMRNKKLKIYTLDYADKNDVAKIVNIYSTERANGFIPYVTTVSLTELVEEPIQSGSAN